MFTGIITGTGTVLAITNHPEQDLAVLTLKAPGHAEDLGLGGSLAVNGVCLTATELDGDTVSVDVMGETLRRTSTGALHPQSVVNLERCTLRAPDSTGTSCRATSTLSAPYWPARITDSGPPSASRYPMTTHRSPQKRAPSHWMASR